VVFFFDIIGNYCVFLYRCKRIIWVFLWKSLRGKNIRNLAGDDIRNKYVDIIPLNVSFF
jgi:hypothetical protein